MRQRTEHDSQTNDGHIAFGRYLEQRASMAGSARTQSLSIALYRLLSGGKPVSADQLGPACGVSGEDAVRLLLEFPLTTMALDDRRAIVAFGGLSIVPTHHRFVTKDAELFTWCVFDALFLPEILGQSATLTTHCPGSGAELTVELDPGPVRAIRPSSYVVSIVAPDAEACCKDVRKAFCNHVNLFRDHEAFRAWSNGRRDVGSVTIQEAQHFARKRNALRYPDIDLGTGG